MTTENLNKEEVEIKEPVEEVNKEEETNQESEVVVSPTETSARESGWVPKEEWEAQGKDPAAWRTAREYLERGELFDEIHKLKDNNKKTSAAFRALVEHHKKVYETAVKEAISKLKAEKKEALENHEIERVFEIDEEIDKVKERKFEMPEVEIPAEDVGPSNTFKAWHKQNKWYQLDGDDEASLYANTVGFQFKQKNPDASEKDFLEHVEKKVARRFPEVFENPNSNRVSEVNPRSGAKGGGGDVFKLTEDEEKACSMFVEQGIMTRKQYIDELKKMRDPL